MGKFGRVVECLLLERTGQCSLEVRLVQAGWLWLYESFGV